MRSTTTAIPWLLLLASVAANVWLCRGRSGAERSETVRDTVRVWDTVRVRMPMARDSAVIRTEVAYLTPVTQHPTPVTQHPTPDTQHPSPVTQHPDTVPVLVPIVQKVYTDSTYTAWVSGYRARLDSIAVYRQTQTVTIRQKPRRWSIGLQAGYGLTPRGPQPYVGVGVTYRLW